MPSLPFTFEDLKNLDASKSNRAANKAADMVDPLAANSDAAQGFLAGKLSKLKDRMSTSDGLIDAGLAINPVLRYTDMASKFFGGPGVAKGFRDGVTQAVGDERSGQSEIRLPPMPF